MFNQLRDAVSSVIKVLGELPMAKKAALAAVAVVMVVGILVTAYLSTGTEYTVLYSNLSQDDALEITQKLKEKNIMYELQAGGTAITVPEMDVHKLRLELAGEGLPSGGAVGYEIFDQSSFGMTEFVQNINYRRALQGELQRTINSMGNIKSSRVHIAIPRRTLFEDEDNKAKASVVLKLSGSRSLSQERVDSITHLVSSSVEGLAPGQVTIVDTRGNLLSSPEEDSEIGRLSVKQMEYRRMYEADMEKRLRTMLERAVGMGRAVVRVNATMDFSQVQRTEEIFDPASQVARSEQRMEEESTGASMPSGVAGVSSNLPGVEKNEAVFSKPASSNKVNETINYEINKTVQTVVEPTSEVTKLSVAVLVDGKYTGKEGEENASPQWTALSQEEIQRLESLVRSAIGFDPDRQDSVTIESMQFDVPPVDTSMEGEAVMTNADLIVNIVKYVGLAGLAAAMFFLVIRPLLGYMGGASAEVEELRTFPKTVEDMEAELSKISESPESKVDNREKVSQLVMENPEQAANLVRAWLRTRG